MQIKFRLIVLFSFIALLSYGQSQQKTDSLVSVMCKTINDDAALPDTTRMINAYEKHLYPFVARYAKAQRHDVAQTVFLRLQRNCKSFKDILLRLDPPKGDWVMADEMPPTKLSKGDRKAFSDHKKYKYIENTGDTTDLTIDKGYWTDRFKDRTYSKLKFYWIGDCDFEIEFIASNNENRAKFSKPGDKYRYRIVDHGQGFYNMAVEIPGTKGCMLFKLYY